MTDYVIDEMVVRNAWHGKKPDKSNADGELKFLADVFYNNYHVSVSQKIRSKFNKFRDDHQQITAGVNDLVLKNFIKLLHDSSRCTITEPTKTDFKGVKKCDNEFVGVALKTKSILVSADSGIKDAISKDPVAKKVKCLTVEEILDNQDNSG